MKILYDAMRTKKRYISHRDLLDEARWLGLTPQATTQDLLDELHRRGLYEINRGRFVREGKA